MKTRDRHVSRQRSIGRYRHAVCYGAFLGLAGLVFAETPNHEQAENPPVLTRPASIDSSELLDFDKCSHAVQSLLERCLALTRKNLGYQYGSSDPTLGGMDCSGTIYFVLQAAGITSVPRTASEQYVWARKAGTFHAVISRSLDSFELDAMRPGDLLFWTGTYATDRDPPVTHSMIYLGKRKADGRQVMFGASDGRSYDERKIWGVSVFDFTVSRPNAPPVPGVSTKPNSVFVGYARIPDLERQATNEASSQ